MAIQTLKHIKEIDGYKINHRPDLSGEGNILINHDTNTIIFRIQNGPVVKNGVNGCQVHTIIETAKIILEGLDKLVPSSYNTEAIISLRNAIYKLKERKKHLVKT